MARVLLHPQTSSIFRSQPLRKLVDLSIKLNVPADVLATRAKAAVRQVRYCIVKTYVSFDVQDAEPQVGGVKLFCQIPIC